MYPHKKIIPANLFLCLLIICLSPQAQSFKVSYSASGKPFSGKVLLYLSKDTKNPKDAGVGLPRLACFAIDVYNVKPNTTVVIDDKAIAYPVKLSDLERGEYYVQAVWDRNSGGRNIANSPDNMYSKSLKLLLSKNIKQVFTIRCNEVVPPPAFQETMFIKELKASSPLLSSFYNKPTTINAAIVLPKEYYREPGRKFPVLFEISGYGGDYHTDYTYGDDSTSIPIDSVPCIYVFLDGNCSWGHSEYANSDNNGPWADALIKELIPLLEKTYRCNGARLLWGHSSGGWASLWLQIQYPGIFTGCWSSAPDPVDFRNFTGTDLYTDKNMYYKEDSILKPDATVAGYFPWVYARDAYQLEEVIYRGEQMHSFEAVFSKKTKKGIPARLCNTQTGDIDSSVVNDWKKYDISLLLRTDWEKYKAGVDKKIRISTGKADNYFLNRSVKLLEEEMKKLNAGFEFSYYPGDHFTIATREYFEAGYRFLKQRYIKWLEENPSPANQ